MTPTSQAQYQARAQVLKALAHPTRLWLIDQLQNGECCVCDLVDGIDADFSTVSKHLSQLRSAGIVSSQRQGKKIFYRLNTPCLANLFGCVEDVLARQSSAL